MGSGPGAPAGTHMGDKVSTHIGNTFGPVELK
jgi:hypothetical protein